MIDIIFGGWHSRFAELLYPWSLGSQRWRPRLLAHYKSAIFITFWKWLEILLLWLISFWRVAISICKTLTLTEPVFSTLTTPVTQPSRFDNVVQECQAYNSVELNNDIAILLGIILEGGTLDLRNLYDDGASLCRMCSASTPCSAITWTRRMTT